MSINPFSESRVEVAFEGHAPETRRMLLELRALILEAGEEIEAAGGLTETLKWGQPSYLPNKPRVGTTVRIDARKAPEVGCALFVHCQTRLAEEFRELYPGVFTFEGNRALLFEADEELPREALKHCIGLALTYHLRRRHG